MTARKSCPDGETGQLDRDRNYIDSSSLAQNGHVPDGQVPDITDVLTGTDWDKIAAHLDGAFVILVKTTRGTYRRRCFLTVASAERAVQRAQERGENAVVVLAELKPLYRVAGGGLS